MKAMKMIKQKYDADTTTSINSVRMLRALKQPFEKVDYANPHRVFSDEMMPPMHTCSLFQGELQIITTFEFRQLAYQYIAAKRDETPTELINKLI